MTKKKKLRAHPTMGKGTRSKGREGEAPEEGEEAQQGLPATRMKGRGGSSFSSSCCRTELREGERARERTGEKRENEGEGKRRRQRMGAWHPGITQVCQHTG